MTHTLHAVIVAVLAVGGASAYEPTPDQRAIAEAIAMGQSRLDAQRARFHDQYRVLANQAPVDYVEIVTPFRRVALAAEGRARVGDRLFSHRDALQVLAEAGDRLELFVELTFHPHNTYVGVPGYTMALWQASSVRPIVPSDLTRVPRFGARLEGAPLLYPFPIVPPTPAGTQPMLGGTLIAGFDARELKAGDRYEAIVSEGGTPLARVQVDLARVR